MNDAPSYSSSINLGNHGSASIPPLDHNIPSSSTSTTAAPGTNNKGKQPGLKVNIVGPDSQHYEQECSSPIDIIDPAKPRQSHRTPEPHYNPFTTPVGTIEHFAQTSRSSEEAFYKFVEAKGLGEYIPIIPHIDDSFLSTSYMPPYGRDGFGRVRTPTPRPTPINLSHAFGGLAESMWSNSTNGMAQGGTTPMFFMSPTNSMPTSPRSHLAHQIPTRSGRDPIAEAINFAMGRKEFEKNARKSANQPTSPSFDLGSFSRRPFEVSSLSLGQSDNFNAQNLNAAKNARDLPADTANPGSGYRAASVHSSSPPSPIPQNHTSTDFIFAPQPVSPVIRRVSMITQALKDEEEELSDIFAIIPPSAMATVVSPPCLVLFNASCRYHKSELFESSTMFWFC